MQVAATQWDSAIGVDIWIGQIVSKNKCAVPKRKTSWEK